MTLVRAGGPASAKPHLPAARAERGRPQSKLQARDARFPLATILSWSLLRQVSVIRQVFPWDRTAHRETAVCGGDIRRSAVRPGPTAPRSPAPAGSPAAVTSSQREPHPRGCAAASRQAAPPRPSPPGPAPLRSPSRPRDKSPRPDGLLADLGPCRACLVALRRPLRLWGAMPVTEKATSRTAQAARQRVFTRGFSLGADAQSELWKRPRHRVGSTQVGRGTSGAFYFLRGIFFFCFFFFKTKNASNFRD